MLLVLIHLGYNDTLSEIARLFPSADDDGGDRRALRRQSDAIWTCCFATTASACEGAIPIIPRSYAERAHGPTTASWLSVVLPRSKAVFTLASHLVASCSAESHVVQATSAMSSSTWGQASVMGQLPASAASSPPLSGADVTECERGGGQLRRRSTSCGRRSSNCNEVGVGSPPCRLCRLALFHPSPRFSPFLSHVMLRERTSQISALRARGTENRPSGTSAFADLRVWQQCRLTLTVLCSCFNHCI